MNLRKKITGAEDDDDEEEDEDDWELVDGVTFWKCRRSLLTTEDRA